MPDRDNHEWAAEIERIYFQRDRMPEISDLPGGSNLDTVIYGRDDRRDVYEMHKGNSMERALLKRLVASTVLLTKKWLLQEMPGGRYRLRTWSYGQPEKKGSRPLPPCKGEAFAHQHEGGGGTGFLAGPDIIVTAGHCFGPEGDFSDTAFIFGFRAEDPADPGTTIFDRDQVYCGKEMIEHHCSHDGEWYRDTLDYAIIRLDRVVTAPGAVPFEVRQSGEIDIGEPVGVIGHPSGLPVKIAFGPDTKVKEHDGPWLKANLDTFGGNSGSPVVNMKGVVEGILVHGEQDYVFDAGNGCFRCNHMVRADKAETITKSSNFVAQIP